MLQKTPFAPLLIFFVGAKFDDLRGEFSVIFFDCRIVLFRRVYVAVTENVGNEIYVAGCSV